MTGTMLLDEQVKVTSQKGIKYLNGPPRLHPNKGIQVLFSFGVHDMICIRDPWRLLPGR